MAYPEGVQGAPGPPVQGPHSSGVSRGCSGCTRTPCAWGPHSSGVSRGCSGCCAVAPFQWRIQRVFRVHQDPLCMGASFPEGVQGAPGPPVQLNNCSQHRKQTATYYVSCTYWQKRKAIRGGAWGLYSHGQCCSMH